MYFGIGENELGYINSMIRDSFTQEQIADVLHTQKSNISRLENANSVNSPKLSTIEQYADAVGYDVEIKFTPKRAHNK